MHLKWKRQRVEAVAAAIGDLTGTLAVEAAAVADRVGARLYDISRYAHQERGTVYVYARIVDGQIRRVLSVGYPRNSSSSSPRSYRRMMQRAVSEAEAALEAVGDDEIGPGELLQRRMS